jgi:hypothetical protein
MKSYPTHYLRAKKLEGNLLDYLNTTQPFKYHDTFNNVDLPITPYYPSMYRYSQFDIYNEYLTIELKSRTNTFDTLHNNILDTNKVINNHSIFCFTYNNQTEILNDLHFIPYDKTIFDTFQIQHTQNNCKLYVIPKTEATFKKLDTTTPLTHTINIHYTDDYKDNLNTIIATDTTKYVSTFGLYAL